MWYHLILIISLTMASQMISIFNFSSEAKIDKWQIVNDGVMGGLSTSTIQLSEEGHGRFAGHVSLENNGGFASLRFPCIVEVENHEQEIILKIKGDGKTYQCRLKGSKSQSESYVHEFNTTGEWQTIKLKLKDFYPQYRGRKLERPNFNFDNIELFGFLISNKKEEGFQLLIDSIELK
jgi:NADH dehydrogenase [ubiquinone] 1 alpha subcomplex assembly factor 1